MAGHYQSPPVLMAVAMEEVNMSCDQRQNNLEAPETTFRLPPGYPCGPKPKKVINGKADGRGRNDWNEAQRAKVYHWFKMAEKVIPTTAGCTRFVQEMWKREFVVKANDSSKEIITSERGMDSSDPSTWWYWFSKKKGEEKQSETDDPSSFSKRKGEEKQSETDHPSRNTIMKLIACYDNNEDYIDKRALNSGKKKTTNTPEFISMINARFEEMKKSKQEISLRPLAREYGVSPSTIALAKKDWLLRRRTNSSGKKRKSAGDEIQSIPDPIQLV